MARGGVKFLRGSVGDYVSYFMSEDGRGCLDHGYYGEGQRWTVGPAGRVVEGPWSAQGYAAWLSGADPETGERRGRVFHEGELRTGVRAYEYGINTPKSASVAAWLDPELAVALRGAQERAAVAGVQAVRRAARVRLTQDHVTRLVEVEQVEVAVFGHDGSREGDPHAHLHVQVGAKALVGGEWKALAGRQMVRALGDWHATVTAALATDAQWVSACARRGLTVTAEGGVAEIGPEVEALFSRRDAAIRGEQERLVEEFTTEQGHAPGARDLVRLHQLAWNLTRPRKGERALLSPQEVRARMIEAGAGDVVRGVEEHRGFAAAGYQRPAALAEALAEAATREILTEEGLRLVAATGVARAGGAVEDIEAELVLMTGALRAQCVPARLPGGDDVWVPASVMASARAVQADLAAVREAAVVQAGALRALRVDGLTPGQRLVAEAVAGGLPVVVEGPAGTGKTTALRRALEARSAAGLRTVAIAPSRTAVDQMGTGWTLDATAHKLLALAGWAQGSDGRWVPPVDGATLAELHGAALIVDEAGMLDLHTMAAVTALARQHDARVILVGDDRQLSPVGAAGGFALARSGSDVVTLTETMRFDDPRYGDLAAAWRSGGDVDAIADQVMDTGRVRIHATVEEAQIAMAEAAAANRSALVMVADNATAVTVNRLVRAELEEAGRVGPAEGRLGRHGEAIGVGDLVQTRSNDRARGLVNRQRWIVTEVRADGGLMLLRADQDPAAGNPIRQEVDAAYVAADVHRADAVTVHAAQGATSDVAHALLDDTWTREQAYVALTRGRRANVLHVVAEDRGDARDLLVRVLMSSQAERAAALVAVTTQRVHEARVDLTPSLVDRVEAGLRRLSQRVARWGTASALSTASQTDAPAAPQASVVEQPVAEL